MQNANKYHVLINDRERSMIIDSLNDLRNNLIKQEKYTSEVNDVLVKVIGAKKKKFKIIYMKICLHLKNYILTFPQRTNRRKTIFKPL